MASSAVNSTLENRPQNIAVHWFRQDLRLADNPALAEAVSSGQLLPIFILDEESENAVPLGGAARCWLHHSLQSLNEQLQGRLQLYRGKAEDILHRLCKRHSIASVHWNRCYEPWRIARDTQIKHSLKAMDVLVHSHNGSLLWEPWQVLKADQTPYRVYTPYFNRGCMLHGPMPRHPVAQPEIREFAEDDFGGEALANLDLLPALPWHQTIMSHWQVSEDNAHQQLHAFLEHRLAEYKKGRDFPGQQAVSGLSPYLHWGQISPHQIWHQLQLWESEENLEHFKRELGWREFSYYQLYHFPELPHTNLQTKFDHFPWLHNSPLLKLWQRGNTGYPLVDAGMRELWQTGTMHNRVRMVVASFLVKNLNIHWSEGARWFQDCLLDADLASNSANWQWVAGCGLDAAPYFRIFNPTTQGEKFDKRGEYTRDFVPELAALPDKYLYKPWSAPAEILADAGVELGNHYPNPIVDLKVSREQALQHYQAIRSLQSEV